MSPRDQPPRLPSPETNATIDAVTGVRVAAHPRWVDRPSCLRCNKPFRAESKAYYLCEPCRKLANRLYHPQFSGW